MTNEFAEFLKKSADTKALPCKTIGELYGVNGKKFQRQYKQSISNFKDWEQKPHAEDWVLYLENISKQLSLDEVVLCNRTSLKINRKSRFKVNEITLDMAGSMKLIAKRCFPNATHVIDHFSCSEASCRSFAGN